MWFLWLLALAQVALGARVLLRMVRTAGGTALRLEPASAETAVSVIVPVLDEERRLGPCLDGLIAAGPEVREILVVDGGSADATVALVRDYATRDGRVRVIDASPIPAGWNGKAWGLETGLRAAACDWVATIDADVRPRPDLVGAMVAQAERERVDVLSVATSQLLGDPGEGLLHPAMLTTLVYRYGLPGRATADAALVQANGQCFLARRAVLVAVDAFARARRSVCEDVTAARALARAGHRVGFYEAGDFVVVRMHANWRETWTNWPRSLTLRDGDAPAHALAGLAEIAFVQALPLPVAVVLACTHAAGVAAHVVFAIEAALVMMRLGVLAGTYRAYRNPPWTYALSFLADLPVLALLIASFCARRHTWRGRTLVTSERTT